MVLPNLLISIMLMFYTFYFLSFFAKSKRDKIIDYNKNLNKYRDIPIKTLEEQKQFLKAKYPDSPKFKFSWMWLGKTIIRIIIAFSVVRGYMYLLSVLNISFSWLHVIIIFLTIPTIINIILSKFNLQKSDITVFLK